MRSGGETFVPDVFNLSTEFAQGVYQYADGALLHALCTGDDAGARSYAEVGGEETHGGAGGKDIYMSGISVEGASHHYGVVTIAQIAGQDIAVGKGVEDECPVTDTFGCRELYGCLQ